MGILGFLRSDDAVSPVVGSILMVAIVVVLAAVLGVVTMGVQTPDQRPQLAFEFEFTDHDASREDVLSIVHAGGDTIEVGPGGENQHSNHDPRNIYIASTHGFEDDTTGSGFECDVEYRCPFDFDDDFTVAGDTMTAGEEFGIWAEEPGTPFEAATVRIVWKSPEGGESQVISTWEGPEA